MNRRMSSRKYIASTQANAAKPDIEEISLAGRRSQAAGRDIGAIVMLVRRAVDHVTASATADPAFQRRKLRHEATIVRQLDPTTVQQW
jgi:hypothetical protein